MNRCRILSLFTALAALGVMAASAGLAHALPYWP